MNNDGNRDNNFEQDEFVRRARELLASEAENLNAPVRSKLTQARHAALDELPPEREGLGSRGWGFIFGNMSWAPAGAAAVFAAVAIGWWVTNPGRVDPGLTQPELPQTALVQTESGEQKMSPDDFDMLMSDEGMEMLDDLDFYAWLEAELPDGTDAAG